MRAEIKQFLERPGYLMVDGVLNFGTVPHLRRKGIDLIANLDKLTIDFQNVTRSDSSGLALLTAWVRYANNQGKSLHYINIPEQLLDLAKVCNLDHILPL